MSARVFKSFDPNGNNYSFRLETGTLPKNLGGSGPSGAWVTTDFPPIDQKNPSTSVSNGAVFNFHFEPGIMTDTELDYLNGLIEEYKRVVVNNDETSTTKYVITPARKEQIWRALNWAPVLHQFAYVISYSEVSRFKNVFFVELTQDDRESWYASPEDLGSGPITYEE